MRTLRNFKCEECNSIKEEFIDSSTNTMECKECGGESTKMLSSARYLGNSTGRSPALVKR